MTSLQERSGPTPSQGVRPTPRLLALLTGVFVLSVLTFAVGLLLPVYANGLQDVPPSELGAYEPERIWPPLGTPWRAVVGLAFLLVIPAFVALGLAAGAAVRAAYLAVRARSAIALAFAVVALGCGAALVWLISPTGSALMTWRLD